MPMPIENMSRRPKRSPRAAPVSRKTAKSSVYAFTVHSSPLRPACRSCADHRDRGRHDEVVERHHEERGRGDRERPPDVCFVSHHLPPSEKKRTITVGSLQPSTSRRPRSLGRRIHRGEHVHEHPVREERRELLRRDARDALDVADEIAVAVPDDGADLRVVAGGVGLHLRPQVDPVGFQQLAIGLRRSRAGPPRPACPRPPAGRSRASAGSTGRPRPCRAPSSSRRDGRRTAARSPRGGRSRRSRRRGGPSPRIRRSPRRGSPRAAPSFVFRSVTHHGSYVSDDLLVCQEPRPPDRGRPP